MMANVNDYTTEELRRLTGLTTSKMRRGEYAASSAFGGAFLRTDLPLDKDGAIVGTNGYGYDGIGDAIRRRVRSFTDPTELDPPVETMRAELERRRKLADCIAAFPVGARFASHLRKGEVLTVAKVVNTGSTTYAETADGGWFDITLISPAPALRFKQGDVVVRTGGGAGQLATVDKDVPDSTSLMPVTLDPRHRTQGCSGSPWEPGLARLATPADIAAFEARVPKPSPRFKEGDLVATVASGAVKPVEKVVLGYTPCYEIGGGWMYQQQELRPATDAEVAAYHRTHCTPKVAISNATHAGRRVKAIYGAGIVLQESAARSLRSQNGLTGDVLWVLDGEGELQATTPDDLTLLD